MIGKDRFLSWFWWLSIRLEPWIQFFPELTVMLNGFILLRILALGLGKFGLKKQKHGAPRAYWIGMIKATNAGNGKPHSLFNHSAPCFSILSFFFSWLKGAWIPKSFRWSRRLHSKMSNFKPHFRMHFCHLTIHFFHSGHLAGLARPTFFPSPTSLPKISLPYCKNLLFLSPTV